MESILEDDCQSGRDSGLQVLGPVPPPIETVRGRVRRQMVVMGYDSSRVRSIIHGWAEVAKIPSRTSRYKVDVDPVSLL